MFEITANYVRGILDYDASTGVFHWKHSGRRAGGKTGRGYFRIWIDGKHYASHRVAWLHHYGSWPKQQIDHINRDPGDNRIANLRDVSASENCKNRIHKVRGRRRRTQGITRHKCGWQVQVWSQEKKKVEYVGVFKCCGVALRQARKAMDL